MKVLFVTRRTAFSGHGGDTVQMLKTAEALAKLGVQVTISDAESARYLDYDLIHFFNLRSPQDLLLPVREAKRSGVPLVLSTIWGSYHEGDVKGRKGILSFLAKKLSEHKLEYSKALARAIINRNFSRKMIGYFMNGHLKSQKEIISRVDVLLPNSSTELDRVRLDMGFPDKLGVVVPNAVDLETFDFDGVVVRKEFEKYSGCILCAARIESRKGQLELIKAVKDTPFQLVIVGKPSKNSGYYYEECLREAEDNVQFISHIEHEGLAQLYKVAKAHALISWMETPGLSSLEAGVMGCNLLITNRGDTEYYFGDMATYVEPGDVVSIRRGIEAVMSTDFDLSLQKHIASNFTWEKTAEMTLKGYQLAAEIQ